MAQAVAPNNQMIARMVRSVARDFNFSDSVMALFSRKPETFAVFFSQPSTPRIPPCFGCLLLNLENAVQPQMETMNTDGHGYQALAGCERLTRRVSEARNPKSVFIRTTIHESFVFLRKFSRCVVARASRPCHYLGCGASRAGFIRVHAWFMTFSCDSNCGI